jgi:hypothetical protein
MVESDKFLFYNRSRLLGGISCEGGVFQKLKKGRGGKTKVLPFFIWFISAVLFLACDNVDKGLEDLKDMSKSYEGRIDSDGCISLKNYVENVKKGYSKFLDSLRSDSAFPSKLHEFLKDSHGLGCDSASLRLNNGPYSVNVFLKNSYSMDGYINGRTKFKTMTSALLNDLTQKNIGTLYHFNKEANLDTASRDTKKLGEFIQKLDYQTFSEKGLPNGGFEEKRAAREFSDLVSIMETAISKTNSLSMSVVISDLNMIESDRIDLKKPGSYENIISEVSDGIRNLLRDREELSLLVLRLESEFYGYYYDIKGNCYIDTSISFKEIQDRVKPTEDKKKWEESKLKEDRNLLNEIEYNSDAESLEKIKEIKKRINYRIKAIANYEKEIAYLKKGCPVKTDMKKFFLRPYFIWIFGTEPQLENVLKTEFFEKKNFDIAKYIRKRNNNSIAELQVLDCPEYKSIKGKTNCPEGQSYDTLNLAFYRIFSDSISVSKKHENKLEIPVRLNFGRVARLASDILEDSNLYELNDTMNFSLEKHKNPNEFVVKSKDSSKYDICNIHFLSAEIKPKYDWRKYSCYDDLNFVDNYEKKQTPGLDSLLGKVHSLFYKEPLSSFQIKIGVKKCNQ